MRGPLLPWNGDDQFPAQVMQCRGDSPTGPRTWRVGEVTLT